MAGSHFASHLPHAPFRVSSGDWFGAYKHLSFSFCFNRIQLMQYVIYGIASFFFLYGIILLAEGFYTTSAVKELHSEFKTTICGRCISGMVCSNNLTLERRVL